MDEKNTMDRLKEFWNSKTETAQRTIIFSAIALVVLIGSLVYLYARDSYEFLLSTSDTAASANVINQLKEQNIKYNVKGESIYVSGVNPDALRLELAGNGYLDSDTSNMELFSKTLFISEKQEAKLIQKDLENNIAAAIKSYNEVADAKVILTMGTQSSFKNDAVPATAAIQLKLKSNLSSKQVKSIQEFVSAAVPNLSSSEVVITDTNNNLLSSGGGANASIEDNTNYTKAIEDKISSQISELLSVAFPTTGFKVVSRVQVNFDETKIQKETVSSGPDTVVSKETHTETTTQATGNGNVGTENNVPNYQTPNNNNGNVITEIKDEIINYETNKTTEQITKQPEITNVNVTVVADKKLSAVDITKITDLVETASGYNEKRGDKVSVQSFDAEAQAEEKESFVGFIKNNFDTLTSFTLMLVLIIAIIIIALNLIKAFKKEKPDVSIVENVPSGATGEAMFETGIDNLDLIVPAVQKDNPELMKKKDIIKKEIEENPQQVASVFKTWLDKEK